MAAAPLALSQGFINEASFKRYNKNPASFDAIVQSWDTGNKVGPECSYSVCTTWGVVKEHYYLLDVWRQRVDFGGLRRAVRSQAQLLRATVILVEDKASGTQLIQDLRAEGVRGITPYFPQSDKTARMQAQAGVLSSPAPLHGPTRKLTLIAALLHGMDSHSELFCSCSPPGALRAVVSRLNHSRTKAATAAAAFEEVARKAKCHDEIIMSPRTGRVCGLALRGVFNGKVLEFLPQLWAQLKVS